MGRLEAAPGYGFVQPEQQHGCGVQDNGHDGRHTRWVRCRNGGPGAGSTGDAMPAGVRWEGPQTSIPLAPGQRLSTVFDAQEHPWLSPGPLCLLSFERPLGCCTLLLPHGRGGIWVLHKENHETCLNWVEPQVRICIIVFSFGRTRPPYSQLTQKRSQEGGFASLSRGVTRSWGLLRG